MITTEAATLLTPARYRELDGLHVYLERCVTFACGTPPTSTEAIILTTQLRELRTRLDRLALELMQAAIATRPSTRVTSQVIDQPSCDLITETGLPSCLPVTPIRQTRSRRPNGMSRGMVLACWQGGERNHKTIAIRCGLERWQVEQYLTKLRAQGCIPSPPGAPVQPKEPIR